MSISLVGTQTASATTVTIPSHQAGDLILIWAERNSSGTAPSLPAGFTNVLTVAQGSNVSARLGYRIANGSTDTSGTWTNAAEITCHVYRPSAGNVLRIGQSASSSSTTTTVTYPALTLADSGGNSWIAGFAAANNITQTLSTAPSGMTNESSLVGGVGQVAGADTEGGVGSWSVQTVSAGTGNSVSATVEIVLASTSNPLSGIVYQHIGGGGNDFNASNPSSTPFAYTMPLDTTSGAGNTIIVTISYDGGATAPTVSGAVNGSFGAAVKTALGGAGKVDTGIWIFQNISAGLETITATFSGAITIYQYCITELYGVATTGGIQGSSSVAANTTIGAGSFTPTNNDGTGGNFIYAYFTKCVQAASGLTVGIFPGTNFTLMNADIGWFNAAASVTKAVEGYIQTTHAAINPAITSIAESVDAWNSIAIALKISSGSGTAPPSGIQINKIDHFTSRNYPSSGTYALQCPAIGNLRAVCTTDGGISSGTIVRDNEGNTWTNDGTGIPGGSFWYLPNAIPNPNLVVFIDGGGSSISVSWRYADLSNAAYQPFDSAVASPGQNLNGLSSFSLSPSPSPSNTNGMLLFNVGLGAGPGLAITAPSGGIWDLCLYSGEVDSDAIENADIMAHYHNTASGAITVTFTITNQASNNTSGGTICFLASTGPGVTTQPQNQTIYVGQTATFTVAGYSTGGALSYQWQQYTGGSWTNVGTNSTSYTTGTLTFSDYGDQFRCQVTDNNGTTNSNVAETLVVGISSIAWTT